MMVACTLKTPVSCYALWSAMFLSASSLLIASTVRASRVLEEKFPRICSACAFLLLCMGEGEAEDEGLGEFRGAWVESSRRLLLDPE